MSFSFRVYGACISVFHFLIVIRRSFGACGKFENSFFFFSVCIVQKRVLICCNFFSSDKFPRKSPWTCDGKFIRIFSGCNLKLLVIVDLKIFFFFLQGYYYCRKNCRSQVVICKLIKELIDAHLFIIFFNTYFSFFNIKLLPIVCRGKIFDLCKKFSHNIE